MVCMVISQTPDTLAKASPNDNGEIVRGLLTLDPLSSAVMPGKFLAQKRLKTNKQSLGSLILFTEECFQTFPVHSIMLSAGG